MIRGIAFDVAHALSAAVLLLSFALLYQRRISGLLQVYALQAMAVAAAAAWQAATEGSPHLYLTAVITLAFKGVFVPVMLGRIVRRLGIHRGIETVIGINLTMLAGVGVVALSILLVFPVASESAVLTRESLALALSIVLLGLLMMISRRNAVSQVVGFLSLENGLVVAAIGVRGMPLIVEMSIAFSVLVAFLLFGMFFFRIRERFDTLDLAYLEQARGEGAQAWSETDQREPPR